MTQKEAVRDVLHANKAHQQALKAYAERLEAELKTADRLISALEAQGRDSDEDNGQGLVLVDGAVKPTSIVMPSALLSEDSPFYEDARWKKGYDDYVGSVPMKAKEHDALTDAVRVENQRIFALAAQSRGEQPFDALKSHPLNYFEQNKEGIDWNRVSKKVSASIPSGAPRSAKECEIRWLGYLHPDINKDSWSAEESERLRNILSEKRGTNIDWVKVSKQLGTNRVPLDCMRQGSTRQTHQWTPETDKKLLDAVEVYGQHNWQLIAKAVSEDATARQCQKRYNDTLDPSLRRGAWSEDEDTKLSRAVAAFTDTPLENIRATFGSVKLADKGIPWQDVALFVPGRNNNQCRERFQILMNPSEKSQKAAWTTEEDEKLCAVTDGYNGSVEWKEVAENLGNGRTDIQCRKRYGTLKRRRESTVQTSATQPSQTVFNAETGEAIATDSRKAKGKGKAKASATSAFDGTPEVEAGITGGTSSQPLENVAEPSNALEPGQTRTECSKTAPTSAARRVVLRVDRNASMPSSSQADNTAMEMTTGPTRRPRKRKKSHEADLPMTSTKKRKTARGAAQKSGSSARNRRVDAQAEGEDGQVGQGPESRGEPAEVGESVKRGRGGRRVRKNKAAETQQQSESLTMKTNLAEPAKRKRGRPRKNPPSTLAEGTGVEVEKRRELTESMLEQDENEAASKNPAASEQSPQSANVEDETNSTGQEADSRPPRSQEVNGEVSDRRRSNRISKTQIANDAFVQSLAI